MQTLKKKDIKTYQPKAKAKNVDAEPLEEEELDELVNGMGAGISGDEKNVNNSEIETAPQATTDDFARAAVQPNRYLYNVTGSGARGNGITSDESYNIAKGKMLSLLEDITGPQSSSSETFTDFNNNDVVDIDELPSNVARKVTDLIDTVFNNSLDDNQVKTILKIINDKLTNNAK